MDSFICGSCAAVYHDVGEFLEHKKICIAMSVVNQTVETRQPSSVHATVLDADGKSTSFIIINADMDDTLSLGDRFKEVDDVNQLQNPSSSSQQNVSTQITSSESGVLFYRVTCIQIS